jgi:uncharacterized NAD(P)/FAD-binding protein YdhS
VNSAVGVLDDVVAIGSGLSTTYTTIRLLEALTADPLDRVVRITTIERAGEFHAGIPYGQRSGTNALLITSLKDFIPSPERERFVEWLNANRDWMFDEFRRNGGALTADWLTRHETEIATGDWHDLYVPRYLFGLFLRDRINLLTAAATEAGLLEMNYVIGEAADIQKTDVGFTVLLADGRIIQAKVAVLGVGMPAPQRQLTEQGLAEAGLIDDPYDPDIRVSIDRIAARLAGTKGASVLLVGANASTMEMLFRMNDDPRIVATTPNFVVLSPQGALPERLTDADQGADFQPTHLLALQGPSPLSAQAIFDAARQDMGAATAQGLSISDVLSPVFRVMIDLVNDLTHDEKLEFAGIWGVELGRYQRRAGTEYSDLVDALRATGQLSHIAGRFVGVASIGAQGAFVRHTLTDDRESGQQIMDSPMAVIINGSGAGSLKQEGAAGLISALASRGLVQINEFGRGLVVDDELQASENLFVVGPLMSGNVIAGVPVWHMEHCGRIIAYSGSLATSLAARL